MRIRWITYVCFSLLLSFAITFVATNVNSQTNLATPLPLFLHVGKNNEVTSLNIWFPSKTTLTNTATMPVISAKAALTYDLSTDKLLYVKNQNQRLPMASLTKIMTAIIALENKKADDKYLVSKVDLVGEDSMGLEQGEVLTQKDLLYGLILHSGNDAAETFASNYPQGRTAFINAMNQKVKALGLDNTHFTNPTGLEGVGNQYTTANDLLVITRYALVNFPFFAQVASSVNYDIPATNTHKAYVLGNETNLLTSYPGVKGVKTGFTPDAGLCLVTYLDYQGHHIIGVLLGSDDRRGEMKELLDYSLNIEGISPPAHS